MAKTKKCPVCGISTKVGNLERHVKKVHPNEKISIDYSEKEQDELQRVEKREKDSTAVGSKKLYAILSVIIVIMLVAAVYFYLPSEEIQGEPPKAEFPQGTTYDFGTVTNPFDLTHTFTIKNNGVGVLKVNKIETSCHCTTTLFKNRGKTHGPFGMSHDGSPSSWSDEIAPGDTADLTINYDTKFHGLPGDDGDQVRTIFVETNDPLHSRINFEITVHIIRT